MELPCLRSYATNLRKLPNLTNLLDLKDLRNLGRYAIATKRLSFTPKGKYRDTLRQENSEIFSLQATQLQRKAYILTPKGKCRDTLRQGSSEIFSLKKKERRSARARRTGGGEGCYVAPDLACDRGGAREVK